jgi:hypothetical protein
MNLTTVFPCKPWLLLLGAAAFSPLSLSGETRTIGETTAPIPEASTADQVAEYTVDGAPGDQNYPFLRQLKVLATVGEVDARTGRALTGYPDGHAAWLRDDDTLRVAYQSESYATMSNETYDWPMLTGVAFTGSHIHWIDYDRSLFADFLRHGGPASDMVEGSGHLFDTVYNAFGLQVMPKGTRGKAGTWGNQTLPDGTIVPFAEEMRLSSADFFFQSFCGAFYEKANKYGEGIGFADPLWLTAEEWNIQKMFGAPEDGAIDAHETLGLASLAVDVNSRTAYTVPALGQSGYEKILPLNPQSEDFVVLVLAGYNHGVEPAPLRIYVGKKGVDALNRAIRQDDPSVTERDKFLARNGLLYGKIYGLALANDRFAELGIENISTEAKMMDAWLADPTAPDAAPVRFYPTSYQWKGWDKTVAVRDTDTFLWQEADEQPAGHTFFVGDSKTEHPAVDPNPAHQRWIQSMTYEGAFLGFELTHFAEEIAKAGGDLPAFVSARMDRVVPAVDGSLTLEVAQKGIKHGGGGTAATWEDGSAKAVAPDGLMWIRALDADILLVSEDSGNVYGERWYTIPLDPGTMRPLRAGAGYFLAMAGGKENPRARAQVAALPGSFSRATSSEFSGNWNVTAFVTRKADGSFFTKEELAGPGEQRVNASVPLNDSTFLGVVQHKGESGGTIAEHEADYGGQIFVFQLDLPTSAYEPTMAVRASEGSTDDANEG